MFALPTENNGGAANDVSENKDTVAQLEVEASYTMRHNAERGEQLEPWAT